MKIVWAQLTTIIGVLVVFGLRGSHGFSLASGYFEKFCGQTIQIGDGADTMSSGTDWLSNDYSPNKDCIVTLQTLTDRKILLTWTMFNVQGNGTCVDRLSIYDGAGTTLQPLLNSDKQCGYFLEYPAIVSTGNTLTMRMTTDASGEGHNFEFVYTSFTTGTCKDGEWKCKNGRCIDDDVAFDLNDNCGDGSDKDNIGELVSGLLKWGIGVLVAIIIGIVIVLILGCVCCGCCIYHLCCKTSSTPAQQTTVVHAPPPGQDPGMAMHGYPNNGYGQSGSGGYGNKI